MKKHLALILLFLSILINSCKIGGNTQYNNENIPNDITAEIYRLDTIVYNSLKGNIPENVNTILSPLIKENDSIRNNFLNIFNLSSQVLKGTNFEYYYKMYTKNSTEGVASTAVSIGLKDSSFTISYVPKNTEMLISLIKPTGIQNEVIITCIYGKTSEGWKLYVLHIGGYSLFHQNAVKLYLKSKEQYEKGDLLGSALTNVLIPGCLKPVSVYFKYNKEDEINEFTKKVTEEINHKYHFPINVTIESSPKIFNVYPELIPEKNNYFPTIQYKTQILLDDTVALKQEKESIHNKIDDIFPYIKNNKYIIYQAFNKFPDGKTRIRHYGFVTENK